MQSVNGEEAESQEEVGTQKWGEENGMERPEMWHVFADSKGERSCSYGLSEALALNEQGEVIQFCKGKTEIPLE